MRHASSRAQLVTLLHHPAVPARNNDLLPECSRGNATCHGTATPGDRTADTHDRVRTDRIDNTGVVTLRHHGRLHHIGIGRTHARTHVIIPIQDLHIRVINATTGELLRELTLNPDRDYQPTGRPPGPPRKTPRP